MGSDWVAVTIHIRKRTAYEVKEYKNNLNYTYDEFINYLLSREFKRLYPYRKTLKKESIAVSYLKKK